jgi:hypothetical protein
LLFYFQPIVSDEEIINKVANFNCDSVIRTLTVLRILKEEKDKIKAEIDAIDANEIMAPKSILINKKASNTHVANKKKERLDRFEFYTKNADSNELLLLDEELDIMRSMIHLQMIKKGAYHLINRFIKRVDYVLEDLTTNARRSPRLSRGSSAEEEPEAKKTKVVVPASPSFMESAFNFLSGKK